MKKLWCLTFYTWTDDVYREGFHIGLFYTFAEAQATELRYRNTVPGFRDYACEAEIKAIPVIGNDKVVSEVYRYEGWNVNEDFDETDIIQSDCYISREWAECDLRKAQTTWPRKEWALNRCVIGMCDWQEGFVRVKGHDET